MLVSSDPAAPGGTGSTANRERESDLEAGALDLLVKRPVPALGHWKFS